jgi:DNA-binding transcriptional MerR regulator
VAFRRNQVSDQHESEAIYSIGAVATMLDVPTSTLRAWEERYAVVKPNRSRGLQRLYSRNQVEQLKFIKAQIAAGSSAADAHRLLTQHLAGGPVTAQEPPAEDRRVLVLLADRDSYSAALEEFFLRAEGYEVRVATDETQARILFKERSPDLVVVDLLISGGSGFALCGEFTANGSTPVVAVSSLDLPDDAMEVGASAFLVKPIDPAKLVSTVRDLVASTAMARPAAQAEFAR